MIRMNNADFFFQLEIIETLGLVYLNFFTRNLIFKIHELLLMDLKYYFI